MQNFSAASDDEIMTRALSWAGAGRPVALASVVETWGSAPRPVGSHLIVDADGEFAGSVSGGCVEAEVVAEAQALLALPRAPQRDEGRLLEFGVSEETAWRSGLSCGGNIRVFLRPLPARLIALALEARRGRRASVLVADLANGAERLVLVDDLARDPLAATIAERARARAGAVVQTAAGAAFIDVFAPPERLFLVGAVHIAQALAPMARLAGFETIVIDPRSGFASAARFPDVEVVADWPEAAIATLGGLDEDSAVALLTHVPRIDDEAAALALRSSCFYLGALGSRKTHARRLERLRALGFGEADLERVHGPIGLDIGAKSPAEIAISVLAEIIERRRRGSARRRADWAA